MKRDLYRSIRLLRDSERGIQPDPSWVRATRERLFMQVKNTIPSAEAAAKNRETFAAAHPSFLKLARGPVLVVMAVFLVLTGGSFASVRAAEHALPGDALYMLKLVTEQTRLALTSSKPNKVKLKVEFTKRRVEELNTVVRMPEADSEKKGERVSAAADIIKQDLNTIKEQLDEVQKKEPGRREVAETAKVVEKEVTEVAQKLKEAKSELEVKTPEVTKKMSEAHAQAADVGLKALEVLMGVRNDEDAKEVVSEEEIGASISVHKEVAKEAVAEAFELAGTISVTTTTRNGGEEHTSVSTSTESGFLLAKDAEYALNEVQSLIDEDRVDEAVDKLKEASAKSFLAQSQAEDAAGESGAGQIADGDAEPSDSAQTGGDAEGTQQSTGTHATPPTGEGG
jgi:hypothetical protein